jgi:selenide,water dikinase
VSPVGLDRLLQALPKKVDPNLLVGFETSDDAGVYRLTDEIALVVTADIITPPVDDPFVFGQIGAANSLSDVYAMGGRPITCLNLIGFPMTELGPEVLQGIVEGALTKITEAEAVLAGGHTTEDSEPKFGLSVTGVVHPQKFWHNKGARQGDVLILTKRIGSGVLFNANLKGLVPDAAMKACIDSLVTLNKTAARVLQQFDASAVTDVTGFGLAGHALEMAKGSNVTIEIDAEAVPLMAEAANMYEKGVTTGSNANNRAKISDNTRFDYDLSKNSGEIFVDPQTSGGLLAALPESQAQEALGKMHDAGLDAARIIGHIRPPSEPDYLIFK